MQNERSTNSGALAKPVRSRDLEALHPDAIADRAQILALLERAGRDHVKFFRGMNRKIVPETAQILRVASDSMEFKTENFEDLKSDQVFLNFAVDGQPYFLSATRLASQRAGSLRVSIPDAVHRTERRDRIRRPPSGDDPVEIDLLGLSERSIRGRVMDISAGGIGVQVERRELSELGSRCEVRFVGGFRSGEVAHADVRNKSEIGQRGGWTRIGLDVSSVPSGPPPQTENRSAVFPETPVGRLRKSTKIASAGLGMASRRLLRQAGFVRGRRSSSTDELAVIEYSNSSGEKLRAIADSSGATPGAPVVIIPPAWGRTKETTLPLAACIVESFAAAGKPVVVVRFDGVRKRGESHSDPDSKSDHDHFTFSQGVRDIQATIDFLESSEAYGPDKIVLVSFSAAAIEARRATATDRRISGWVSVVGAADLQSMMRVISGGVDYALGLEMGLSFGMQEILGVTVDMDLAGRDALEHDLVYLDDSRRDMAAIHAPVTWIRGKFDAWMDEGRVRDIMSRGETANRRFVTVPTGHMLRTSAEALDTFRLIASEVAAIISDGSIAPVIPALGALEKRRLAERQRLHQLSRDLREFWRRYLIGDSGLRSFELMTAIAPYRDMMRRQIEALQIPDGGTVVDLGSGTGAFPLQLLDEASVERVRVIEVDYVVQGLVAVRDRLSQRVRHPSIEIQEVVCNLDAGRGGGSIALRSGVADAVIASLLLPYVSDPGAVVDEAVRLLRPGGRLVVSSLRPDADMSKLYRDGLEELRARVARDEWDVAELEESARSYLNHASRLLDLEEAGEFRFMESGDLVAILRSAGLRHVEATRALGDPAQAIIVSGCTA